MEYNFDNEMDTLLRQTARSGRVVSTEDFDSHPDADEISMFAENALPEKARARAMKHLAECNNCRNILSNVILLNAETENEAASFINENVGKEKETDAPTAAVIPWHKRLFSFPQLAYAMGALALVFSGAVGFLIYQTANRNAGFEMAKSSPMTANANASSQTAADNEFGESSANLMSANTSIAANSATNADAGIMETTNANSSSPDAPPTKNPSDKESGRSESKDENERSPAENKPKSVVNPTPVDNKNKETDFVLDGADSDDSVMRDAEPPAASAPRKPITRRSGSEPKKKSDKTSAEEEQTKLAGNAETRRQIGGKTFNRVGGVWIDSDYSQKPGANMALPPTKTVRRGTGEYLKLDKNIRIIAESLEGTVIVVSNSKAYRIQ